MYRLTLVALAVVLAGCSLSATGGSTATPTVTPAPVPTADDQTLSGQVKVGQSTTTATADAPESVWIVDEKFEDARALQARTSRVETPESVWIVGEKFEDARALQAPMSRVETPENPDAGDERRDRSGTGSSNSSATPR